MDPMVALDTAVKARLEDTFGKGIAMLIVANASNDAHTPIFGLSKDDYRRLVEVICCDSRVKETWGEAGTKAQLEDWMRLVD